MHETPQHVLTYTDTFEKVCPYYMTMGMSLDEFWNQDPVYARFYRQSYKMKRKVDNEKAWLQGLYVYHAINKLAPILNAFADPDYVEAYDKRPIPLTEEELEEAKKQDELEEAEKMRRYMMEKAARNNAKY